MTPTDDFFHGVTFTRNPLRPAYPPRRRIIGPDGWVVIGMVWAGVLLTIASFKIVDWML